MICYFPDIYPDELIYSLLSRFYIRSGYMSYTYAAQKLFTDKKTRPNIEYLNRFTANATELIIKNISERDLILKHTMFPYYGKFLKNRKEIYCALLPYGKNYNGLLPKIRENNQRYLRYCPLCSSEDRAKYGETYWHRIHQMAEIDDCLIHNCKLINSDTEISNKTSPKFSAAEYAVPHDNDCIFQTKSIFIDLNKYMLEVFNYDIDFDNDTNTGDYVFSRLSDTKYMRGKMRNITLLTHEYNSYYNTNTPVWQIQKVFTNYETKFKNICMLAMFLNITPYEICNPMLITQIEKHRIVKAYKKPPGIKPKDWKSLDTEALPKVRNVIDSIFSEEKPKKVSVYAVGKILGLSPKQIEKMPKCKSEILKHYETQEQFWARKVTWAVKNIDEENKNFSWKQIRNLTNICKTDLYSCLPYIENDIRIRICEVL